MIRRMCLALALVLSVALGTGAMAQTTELVYMNWFTGDADALEAPIIEWFNESRADIQVSKLAVEWGVYMDTLMTMIAAGTPPDIVTFDPGDTATMVTQGVLLPLDPYIERDNFDLSVYRRGFVEESIGFQDGLLYGLPWGTGRYLLFYNETMFDRYGLPYPATGWTSDDFVEYGRRLTVDQDGDGVMDQFGMMRQDIGQWVLSFGANFVDRATGKQSMSDPKFISAVEFVRDLTLQYGVQPTWEEQSALAGGGSATMSGRFGMFGNWDGYVGWYITWGLPEVHDFNVAHFPKVGDEPVTMQQKGNSMTIIKLSKNHDAAWEFLKFYSTDRVQNHWAVIGSYPATDSAANQWEFRHPSGYPHVDLLPSIVPPERVDTLPRDVPGWITAYNNLIWPELDRATLGEVDVRQAIEGMAGAVDQMLAEALAQ